MRRRAGNRDDAFVALYHAYFGEVWSWLRQRNVPEADAIDVAQLVFITAFRRLADIPKEHDAAKAWLLATTKNKLSNFNRDRGRETLLPEPDLASPAVHLLERRLIESQLIAKTLEAMPEGRPRDVLEAVYAEGKSDEQIAAELNASESTVRSWLSRGVAEFRAIYVQIAGEEPKEKPDESTRLCLLAFLFARDEVFRAISEILDAVGLDAAAPWQPSPRFTRPRARLVQALVAAPLLLLPVPSDSAPPASIPTATTIPLTAMVPVPPPMVAPSVVEPVVPAPIRRAAPSIRPAPRAPESDKHAERRLLSEATEALVRHRPAEALAMLDDHGMRFPESRFVEEREARAIQALIELERVDDARARLERLKRDMPESRLASAMDRLLGRVQ